MKIVKCGLLLVVTASFWVLNFKTHIVWTWHVNDVNDVNSKYSNHIDSSDTLKGRLSTCLEDILPGLNNPEVHVLRLENSERS